MKIDDWLMEILACPRCHAPLRADEAASELVCTGPDCGLAYPVRDDIPVLLVDEARRPGEARDGGGTGSAGGAQGAGGQAG
jgi:uncharacterized protein YbaR (Trm112 family)